MSNDITVSNWHKSRPYAPRVTYRVWLNQIIRDLKRLNAPDMPTQIVRTTAMTEDHPFGLAAVRRGETLHTADLKPAWLRDVRPPFFLFEVLCAYRCPWGGVPYPTCGADSSWLSWTKKAAEGLFAYESWVRFTSHLFNPLSLNHNDKHDHDVQADLGAEVWSELLGGSFYQMRRWWLDTKYEVESAREAIFYRPNFWPVESKIYGQSRAGEVDPKLLGLV